VDPVRSFSRTLRIPKSVVLDGGLYSLGALLAGAVASLFLLSVLASPNGWKWWNSVSVHGSEQGGVVFYSYQGQTYSMDDVSSMATRPRTVYINPANPNDAALSIEVAQVSDTAIVGGLYLVSAAFLVVVIRRHMSRIRRADDLTRAPFGDGIDPETVQRILAARSPNR
jgi:hypothetical protein